MVPGWFFLHCYLQGSSIRHAIVPFHSWATLPLKWRPILCLDPILSHHHQIGSGRSDPRCVLHLICSIYSGHCLYKACFPSSFSRFKVDIQASLLSFPHLRSTLVQDLHQIETETRSFKMVNLKPFIAASALSSLLSGVTANIFERWQQPLPSCNTTDFVYAGCFTDLSTPSALLDRTNLPSGNMTVQICIDYCKGKIPWLMCLKTLIDIGSR